MTIYFVTRIRGFLKHLLTNQNIDVQFLYDSNHVFETNSVFRKILTKIIHTQIFDWLGVIQVIKCKNKKCDVYGSFNRFLKTDKPYFIYVENPAALYHYSLNKNKSFLGRKNIVKNINNEQLKALVFMTKACADTFEDVCGKIPEYVITETIYPYIPQNKKISLEKIKLRSHNKELKLLYIAQGIRFTSKGGLEIVEAFIQLRDSGCNHITLTMITSMQDVNHSLIDKIKKIDGITLYDFKFSYEELENIYADSHILLQPTSVMIALA
jgi:glycosyltransferase involved in cell wall biosynthesis